MAIKKAKRRFVLTPEVLLDRVRDNVKFCNESGSDQASHYRTGVFFLAYGLMCDILGFEAMYTEAGKAYLEQVKQICNEEHPECPPKT